MKLEWFLTDPLMHRDQPTDRLDQKIFKMMAQNCGKKDDYFKKIVHKKGHADWFLDAEECKKHNICNHIRVPSFTVNIDVNMELD